MIIIIEDWFFLFFFPKLICHIKTNKTQRNNQQQQQKVIKLIFLQQCNFNNITTNLQRTASARCYIACLVIYFERKDSFILFTIPQIHYIIVCQGIFLKCSLN